MASRNASGRVARLTLEGLRPEQISGQDFRVAIGRTLGWQHVKSTAFDLREKNGSYRFSGHGSGHGVGMCVIGAARLAERGTSAESILARYFPGLEISTGSRSGPQLTVTRTAPGGAQVATRSAPGGDQVAIKSRSGRDQGATRATPNAGQVAGRSGPDREQVDGRSTSGRGQVAARPTAGAGAMPEVLVSLPDDDEGEREGIVKQTLKARDDLARRLGVAPPRVILRFHPTTDDYERVTGQAWFTSGAVVKRELHLLPLAVLRSRGVLERTIRHELVHLMTDAPLDKRPAWVREGAAIYFAGEQMIPGDLRQRPAFRPQPRASCPEDNELLHPVSVGALSNAYVRARVCFAKQIDAGRSWQEVR